MIDKEELFSEDLKLKIVHVDHQVLKRILLDMQIREDVDISYYRYSNGEKCACGLKIDDHSFIMEGSNFNQLDRGLYYSALTYLSMSIKGEV